MDSAYSKDEVLDMELQVLNTLVLFGNLIGSFKSLPILLHIIIILMLVLLT